jgi:hypothetical protein
MATTNGRLPPEEDELELLLEDELELELELDEELELLEELELELEDEELLEDELLEGVVPLLPPQPTRATDVKTAASQ